MTAVVLNTAPISAALGLVLHAADSIADRLEAQETRHLSPEIVWTDEAPVSWEWFLADRATVTSQPLAAT